MKTTALFLVGVSMIFLGCSKQEHEVVFEEQAILNAGSVIDRVLWVDYDQCFHDKLRCGIFHARENCKLCDSFSIANYFPSSRTRRTELADTSYPDFGHTRVESKIIHFGRPMKTYQVLHEIDKMGLRPAELTELLELRCNIMKEQRPQFPVVALGSTWWDLSGCGYVPQMDSREPDERAVFMRSAEATWSEAYRFLAVTK